jgi:hypothetical protein
VEAVPTDPRTLKRSGTAPVHRYHVVFWRQATAPEAFPQSRMGWAAHEHEVLDVVDVHEVIGWADEEAHRRRAAYTVYAVIEVFTPRDETPGGAVSEFDRREMAVWLGGWEPTQASSEPNFGRLLPPGAEPTWGDPEDL